MMIFICCFMPKSVACLSAIGLVAAEIADAENVGLHRLDARQKRREVGRAERMADLADALGAESLAGARLKPRSISWP